MVTVDKKTANAGAAIYIQSDLGKAGNTAKIEFFYDANNNGIDDDGGAWTSIAQVTGGGSNSLIQGTSSQIAYRWVPASDLNPGHYLIRVTDTDNSTPKVAGVDLTSPARPQISFLVDGSAATRVSPAGFVQVQADVSNNCALCHSGDPSTWTASSAGFDAAEDEGARKGRLERIDRERKRYGSTGSDDGRSRHCGLERANIALSKGGGKSPSLHPGDRGEFDHFEPQRHRPVTTLRPTELQTRQTF